MKEIKFKYGYTDDNSLFEKVLTLSEIEQGLQFDEISDSLLLKDYKIAHKRQYTGLKDRNGVEIYEGDIVAWGLIDENDISTANGYGVVEYWSGDGCFEIEDIVGATNGISQRHFNTVIGNIYENPELLKEIK